MASSSALLNLAPGAASTSAALLAYSKKAAATTCIPAAAQALALAAKRAGIRATIIMPEGCNPLKLEATEGHGANVLRCEATQESRESTCRE